MTLSTLCFGRVRDEIGDPLNRRCVSQRNKKKIMTRFKISTADKTPLRRNQSIYAALLLGTGMFFSAMTGGTLASDQINDMMSDGNAGAASTATTASGEAAAGVDASAGSAEDPTVRPDKWVTSKDAMGHLNIIAARPLPGETCQNVIFDARPFLKERHEPQSGSQLNFDMKQLCLMGFRNDSDSKSLVIRLGESLETLAIAPDPQLFSGLVVSPGQQVMIALRPLPVETLDVGLEVAWEDDLDSLNPTVGKATLTVNQ